MINVLAAWKRNISVLWQLTADLVISVFCCVWDNLALMSLLSIEISARFHSNWATHCKIIYLSFEMNAIDDVLFSGVSIIPKSLWMVFKPESYTCFAHSIPNTLWELFTLERIHVGASGRGPVREEYTPRPIHVAQCCSPSARVLASLAASGRFAAFGFKNARGI